MIIERSKPMKAVVVFTLGVGLNIWQKKGLFPREMTYLEKLAEQLNLDEVVLMTYDHHMPANVSLPKGFRLCSMPRYFPKHYIGYLLYSLLMPFIHRRDVAGADFVRTVQSNGVWAAVLMKYLWRIPLHFRTGYTLSKIRPSTRLKIRVAELIERLGYAAANSATVSSDHDAKSLQSRLPIRQLDKLVVVKNYVHLPSDIPALERREPSLLFVGRLAPEKNLLNLVQALEGTQLSLVLVGDGPLRAEIEQLVARLSVNVRFLGVQPQAEVARLMRSHRYFVLSSVREGMPKALLEAMAAGAVCVATDVDGNNELVQDGVTGVLSHGIDAPALQDALLRATALPMQEANRLSQNARDLVEREHTLQNALEKEAQVLRPYLA